MVESLAALLNTQASTNIENIALLTIEKCKFISYYGGITYSAYLG